MATPLDKIRNFCIIAHIDHGKSTLADRMLEKTGTISDRDRADQVLDMMDLERERGITIKLQAARMSYQGYELNLIDTPGHVDFTYEVSRSLAACEGAVLLVDATQGIEAQTLANTYLALEHDLEIIPVINKIDMPSANPEMIIHELENTLGFKREEMIMASAKDGTGVEDILSAIIARVPPPETDPDSPLRALIFDSHYDVYRGVIVYIRVKDGVITPGMKIRLMETGAQFEVDELGIFNPWMTKADYLGPGEVGYVIATIKTIENVHVGDTITDAKNPATQSLPGYKKVNPMVYCGLYPVNGEDFELLREAIDKIKLNDSSVFYEPETSQALGFGLRCGFLGLLHLEIIQERLRREFDLALIASAPSVVYKVTLTDGVTVDIDNPSNLPPPQEIEYIEEPHVKTSILLPTEYTGPVIDLCQDRRGVMDHMEYMDEKRVILFYDLPLSEVITDFFDQLKSRTKGYGSLDYEISGYQPAKIVKVDVLLNHEAADALSFLVHQDKAYRKGKALVEKLKELIPKHMFAIPIQAAVGSKVIARETISAIRKDVTAKCYGGDISRKRKLLEKQKEGKKKMKNIGSVDVPQSAFMAILKI
ncbi:MAG: translation elongation factor 4 [Candidatus Margulisiibacteriota bacterium]